MKLLNKNNKNLLYFMKVLNKAAKLENKLEKFKDELMIFNWINWLYIIILNFKIIMKK